MAQIGNQDLHPLLSSIPENKRSRLDLIMEAGRAGGMSPPALAPTPSPRAGPASGEAPTAAQTAVQTAPVGPASTVTMEMNGDDRSTTAATFTGRVSETNTPSTTVMEPLQLNNSSHSYSIGQQMDAWSRSRGDANGDECSLNNASDAEDRRSKRSKIDLSVEQSPDLEAKHGPKQKAVTSFFSVMPKAGGEGRPAKTREARHSLGGSTSNHDSASGGANTSELKRALDILKEAKKSAERDCELKSRELDSEREQRAAIEDKNSLLRKKLEETHRSMAKEAARRNRDRLAADSVRLGKFTVVRVGDAVGEAFEKGYAFHELQAQKEDIIKRKEELETRKQELTKLKRLNKRKSAAQNNSALNAILEDDGIDVEMDTDLDLIAEQHAIAMHAERLKKEEAGFAEKEKLLDAERGSHEKELRRVQCEDKSRYYRDLPLLGEGRYSLLKLLGQGGFSEVWLALDLFTLEEVAVKIHQLNSAWSEDRQRAFVRHAKRELEIHRAIAHPRVVKLVGCFDISNDAFATILEYCRGTDLDEILKKTKNGLTEKEAKPILLQILSGLRFLSTITIGQEKKTIIHYDLKPANILFDEMGDVKITDFGLSKVIDGDSDGTSIDQTSHGAGTYWYLPPECFTKDKISAKVDVWSVGVIYYQMLYGKRPFGEGLTQHTIYKDGTILNARQVDFPSNSDPKVNKISDEAKDFIRGCLTYDQNLRWDVNQMCMSPYVRCR